jgi:hypothetical protein
MYLIFVRGGNLVLVSHTRIEPAARLAALQKCSPVELELLGAIPGSKRAAGRVRDELQGASVRDDWFEYESVKSRIDELLALDGVFLLAPSQSSEKRGHVPVSQAAAALGVPVVDVQKYVQVRTTAGGHRRVFVDELQAAAAARVEPDLSFRSS